MLKYILFIWRLNSFNELIDQIYFAMLPNTAACSIEDMQKSSQIQDPFWKYIFPVSIAERAGQGLSSIELGYAH